VRKHGGWQRNGWRFDFPQLHRKSGSLARFNDFAHDLRCIVARQPLPGYTLAILQARHGPEVLTFHAVPSTAPLRPGGSFGAGVVPVEKM
jgi:plasmid replication initiation protein